MRAQQTAIKPNWCHEVQLRLNVTPGCTSKMELCTRHTTGEILVV